MVPLATLFDLGIVRYQPTSSPHEAWTRIAAPVTVLPYSPWYTVLHSPWYTVLLKTTAPCRVDGRGWTFNPCAIRNGLVQRCKALGTLSWRLTLFSVTRGGMRWFMTFFSLIFLSALVTGCAISVDEYKNEKPVLNVEQFFAGDLEAHGVVAERSGKVVKRFSCQMRGTWDGTTLALDEDFTWSDGTRQKRLWRLKKQPDGTFSGTADDVVGTAFGEVSGNTLHLVYDLSVPVDGSTTVLHVDDWLYLVTEDVLMNHSELTKFGLGAAEVFLTIRKKSSECSRACPLKNVSLPSVR